MELKIEDQAKLIRKLSTKYPTFSLMTSIIDQTFPSGLLGALRIQEDTNKLLNFKGSEKDFEMLLKEQRKKFRRDFGIDEIK
jgi:hypothetical protein